MTFEAITTEVNETLARTDTAVTGKTATWVNERQRQVASRHNFAFMRTATSISTVSGTAAYTLPTDFKDDAVFYLQKTNDRLELPIRGKLEMIRRIGDPTDTGEPAFVTLEPGSTTYTLWPTPDAVYTIMRDYWAWPTDLSGGQTNWLTVNFPRILITGAVADGLAFIGATEEAAGWEAWFERQYAMAHAYDVQRALPSDFRLEPRFDVGHGTETARWKAGWRW